VRRVAELGSLGDKTHIVKRRLIVIVAVIALGFICWWAERMGMKKDVMFDPERRELLTSYLSTL